jgi:uncharacterized coiled-coil DUF342 family protein
MTTSREDDMLDRIRFLEGEIAGEKIVTRHILEKVQRISDEIAAVRTDIGRLDIKNDRLSDEMALVKGAQVTQGQALSVLTQDVRGLRTELSELRTEMNARFDAVIEAIRTARDPAS